MKIKLKIPWIFRFVRKPRFKFILPTIDLTDSTTRMAVFFILLLFSSLMVAGLIYILVQTPPAVAATKGGNPIIVLPGLGNLDRQTVLEGLAVAFLTFLAGLGTYMLKISTEFATEEEARSLWIYGGLFLLAVGLFGMMILFGVKVSPPK